MMMLPQARVAGHPTPSLASVFDTLVADIVSGHYPPGSRLPPERDLARLLGASRPTLREALRRLGEWGLVEPRRGSGVVVRDIRYWSLDVLPAYLRLGAPTQGPHALADMISMLLALRRTMFVDIIRTIGTRIHPDALAEARAAAERAWSVRHDISEFVRADYDVVRSVLLAARFLPALWMMNALAGVYIELARTITGAAILPEDYLAAHHEVIDALERSESEAAAARMARYLDNHDSRLLAAMGIPS